MRAEAYSPEEEEQGAGRPVTKKGLIQTGFLTRYCHVEPYVRRLVRVAPGLNELQPSPRKWWGDEKVPPLAILLYKWPIRSCKRWLIFEDNQPDLSLLPCGQEATDPDPVQKSDELFCFW